MKLITNIPPFGLLNVIATTNLTKFLGAILQHLASWLVLEHYRRPNSQGRGSDLNSKVHASLAVQSRHGPMSLSSAPEQRSHNIAFDSQRAH